MKFSLVLVKWSCCLLKDVHAFGGEIFSELNGNAEADDVTSSDHEQEIRYLVKPKFSVVTL